MEALKWIGIVLAAGFVGYFGRYLAMKIIERVERKKAGEPPSPPATKPVASPDVKVAKKQAKQAAKTAKKAPRD